MCTLPSEIQSINNYVTNQLNIFNSVRLDCKFPILKEFLIRSKIDHQLLAKWRLNGDCDWPILLPVGGVPNKRRLSFCFKRHGARLELFLKSVRGSFYYANINNAASILTETAVHMDSSKRRHSSTSGPREITSLQKTWDFLRIC